MTRTEAAGASGTATAPDGDGSPEPASGASRTRGATASGAGSRWHLLARRLLLLGTPLLLAAALWFHPHGGANLPETLSGVLDTWLPLHVALLPLFGLLGVCLYVLLDGYDGRVATLGRAGVAVYLAFYLPFEAIAGLTTGLLLHDAQSLPPEQQAGVDAVVQGLTEPAIALALVGTVGAILATGALAVLLRRSCVPRLPVVLLAGVPITVIAHGGAKLDVVGALLFFGAVAWLELRWRADGAERRVEADAAEHAAPAAQSET